MIPMVMYSISVHGLNCACSRFPRAFFEKSTYWNAVKRGSPFGPIGTKLPRVNSVAKPTTIKKTPKSDVITTRNFFILLFLRKKLVA